MKRQIVKIDRDLCNGCGLCIPNCHEGALQIIDGKATLVSDLMCDGLGACLGHCPVGAIEIEEREAEPYNEVAVIKEIIPQGVNVLIAHLQHLKEHGETEFLKQGVQYLQSVRNELSFNVDDVKYKVHNNIKPDNKEQHQQIGCGCQGSTEMSFTPEYQKLKVGTQIIEQHSELRQWPVQLHLINPAASYFQNSDLIVAADCVAFSIGNFHSKYLKDKSLVIACPKLDSGTDIYIDKFIQLIDNAKVNTISVMIMEVPCCRGLVQMVKTAVQAASRKVPVKQIIVGIKGQILTDDWI